MTETIKTLRADRAALRAELKEHARTIRLLMKNRDDVIRALEPFAIYAHNCSENIPGECLQGAPIEFFRNASATLAKLKAGKSGEQP